MKRKNPFDQIHATLSQLQGMQVFRAENAEKHDALKALMEARRIPYTEVTVLTMTHEKQPAFRLTQQHYDMLLSALIDRAAQHKLN